MSGDQAQTEKHTEKRTHGTGVHRKERRRIRAILERVARVRALLEIAQLERAAAAARVVIGLEDPELRERSSAYSLLQNAELKTSEAAYAYRHELEAAARELDTHG